MFNKMLYLQIYHIFNKMEKLFQFISVSLEWNENLISIQLQNIMCNNYLFYNI